MSGGSLNYFFSSLEDHVGDFEDPELDDLTKDLAKLFYEREWFLSGDTGAGSWREARDAFKLKWFGNGSQNQRMERIEKYLDDLRAEVLDKFGLSEAYCRNCKHWTRENEKGSKYGNCDINKCCLWHECERCERFEKP